MKRLATALAGALAALLLAGTALADDPAEPCARPPVGDASEALSQLNLLRIKKCLGGAKCTSALCQSVASFEERWRGKPATDLTYREARSRFEQIRGSAAALPRDGLGVPELQRMMQRWSGELDAFGSIDPQRLRALDTAQWEPETGDYRLFARSPDAAIVLKDGLEARCAGGTAPCSAALADAAAVVEHSLLSHRVLRLALGADAVLAPYFESLSRRWSAYNNESRAIYPWELWANAPLLKAPPAGFAEPPDRQYLFLHPGAGVTYRPSREGKPNDTRGVVTLDLFGVYRWQWGGANRTEIRDASGWSVAAGWDGQTVGYGLGLHFSDNRSAYLMRDRDGRTLFVVSIDLGNYLRDKEQAVLELRQRVETLR